MPWEQIAEALWREGHAPTPRLLEPAECGALAALYPKPELFRSRIDMARYRFGQGEYQYFAEPLPSLVASLRKEVYPYLAPVANRWMEALGMKVSFPPTHAESGSFATAAGRRVLRH